MKSSILLRRQFLLGVACLPMTLAANAAEKPRPHDHGIGGTGQSIVGGDDHGIGGTGIVGTIQGFGSIIVNGRRIPYARNVPVFIDGRRVDPNEMRVGHVVRVLLGGQNAQAIHITSEVVGPVSAINKRQMTVLAQRIDLSEAQPLPRLKPGQVVAVFGIRKPDGTIVASRVEKRNRFASPILRGVAERKNGQVRIAGLPIGRPSRHLIGRRVVVGFSVIGGQWRPERVNAEEVVPGLTAGSVNVETFIERNGSGLRAGLGINVGEGGADASPDNGRAFINVPISGGVFEPHSRGPGRPDGPPRFDPDRPGRPPPGQPGTWRSTPGRAGGPPPQGAPSQMGDPPGPPPGPPPD
ncbi:hypothetical protein AS026_31960 [Rhizobium altiplani]|uniref:DUF5666 domain-containing protein n=1 Tax=Rhizobium altiplani TaxID=1864509 RepID=A0A120FPE3_9HYPH|nr:DUF5666 domain-containing protein [Rhizobium altiplani]KWV56837.1 hypothetical protein AS026_31960 [Rhizobium altiplani]